MRDRFALAEVPINMATLYEFVRYGGYKADDDLPRHNRALRFELNPVISIVSDRSLIEVL
jgi:hypothetical protein